MTLSFKRYLAPETYYTDIDLLLPDSVKYDLYNGADLVATLISSNGKSFARFRDGSTYKRHTKIYGNIPYEHLFLNDQDTLFARITVDGSYKGGEAILVFCGDPDSYVLRRGNIQSRKEPYELIIEFKAGDQTVFTFKNTQKGKFASYYSNRPMEGTIEMTDRLHRDKIFGFLLAIQLYYLAQEDD
jgi:hypothetical protein